MTSSPPVSEQHAAAERDWLLAFLSEPSSPEFGQAQGVSSRQLVMFCLGQQAGLNPHDYPWDEADIWRCARAVVMAPEHLKFKARLVLEIYAQSLDERQKRYGKDA
jgi:hypothetical protein